MKKIPLGEDLKKEANRLGVSTLNLGDDPPELQRRVMTAQKHIRDHNLWIVAFVSAMASFVSAIAAWTAIFFRCPKP